MILLNGVEVIFETFPNGESKLNVESMKDSFHFDENVVFFKYENDGDLVRLMILKDLIDYLESPSRLIIAYMPYSRMDRQIEGQVFTLKSIAKIINNLNFSKVMIIEPHSDVTPAIIDNCMPHYINFDLLEDVEKQIRFNKEIDYLFFPDAGAQKRYHSLKGYNQLVGYKDRDTTTGDITSLEIVGNIPERNGGRKILIVDDLCSYGGTFIKSAEKLKELGFQDINLLVAHCENSIFAGKIFTEEKLINKVFTTNSILTDYEHIEELGGHIAHDRLKVYKLEEYL